MNYIDASKVRILTNILEQDRNPHYAIGWMQSMIVDMDLRLGLTKKQIKLFNEMLDDNIRWATKK